MQGFAVIYAGPVLCGKGTFHLSTVDRRVRVFRRKGGRVAQKCLLERDRFGGGSVIVWGGIMGGRKMDLVIINGNLNVQGYVDKFVADCCCAFP